MNYKIINECQVCGKKRLQSILNLGMQPLCDDLRKKIITKKYKNKIIFCNNCYTVFQKFNVNKKKLFHKNYHYRAANTKDVLNGMKSLVSSCENFSGDLKKKKILDIGCNDGSLLNIFKNKGSITYGVEPTNAYISARNSGHKVFNNFFCKETASKIKRIIGNIDIITFTNVFAHIDNLKSLISDLKTLIGKNTLVIIENHYLIEVIEKKQFDTFYHEHPRTYSLHSFNHIAERLDLNVSKVEFIKRYNGNIRVFLSNRKIKDKKRFILSLKKEKKIIKKIYNFQNLVNNWKINKRAELLRYKEKYGSIPAKSFPGRASIPINLLKLNNNLISKIYERDNSLKVGYYCPGTNIKIVPDNNFIKNKDQKSPVVLNFAWHISSEIKNYLKKKLKFKGKIINIISEKDFKK